MKEDLNRIESLVEQGDVSELAEWLGHQDWQRRRAAVEAMISRASTSDAETRDRAVRYLVDGLYSEENAGLRNAGQEALLRLAPRILDLLLGEVASAPTDVLILLAPVLGESGRVEAIEPLVELARAQDVNVATAAIIGLGRVNRGEAVRPLLGILAAGNPWLAFPAVEALGELGDRRAVPALTGRMDDPLLGATVLEALVRVGGPDAARAIAERLFAPGPLRPSLLEALVRIAQETWPPTLADAVRESAIAAFREHNVAERFDQLAELAKPGSSSAESALEALGWTGDVRALPVLLVALGRPASQVSAAAGLSILLVDPAIHGKLDHYVGHLAVPVKLELVRLLAACAPVEAAHLVSGLLADDDEDLVHDAADLAAEIASRLEADGAPSSLRLAETIDRLLDTLGHAIPSARAVGARLVKALAAGSPTEAARMRARALAEQADADLRLMAVDLLASWTGIGPAERAILVDAMGDADPFVRVRAIEIGSEDGGESLRPHFIAALSDPEPLVRRAAVAVIAEYDDEAAERALLTAARDWHGMVAADALTALAARGGEESHASLEAASRSDRALLRCVAVRWLANDASDAARSRVLELAALDPEAEVRRTAVAALAGTPGAHEAISAAIDDPNRTVRYTGVRLAVDSPDAGFCARIAEIAGEDESEEVRGEALVALAACSPEAALERIGAAMLEPGLAAYAVRALALLAERAPEALTRYREAGAPPRVAFAVDTLFGEKLG